MTEQEMAVAIGEKFLQLHKRMTAMEAILNHAVMSDNTKLNWPPMLEFEEVALGSNKIYRDGYDLLQSSIDATTPNLPLIGVLYRLFVSDRSFPFGHIPD